MWRAFSRVRLLQMPAHWANYLVIVRANLKGQYPPQKPVHLFPSLIKATSVNRIWPSSEEVNGKASLAFRGHRKTATTVCRGLKSFQPKKYPWYEHPNFQVTNPGCAGANANTLKAQRGHLQNCGRALSPLQQRRGERHLQNDTDHHYNLCREKVRDTSKNCSNFWVSCP